MGFYKAVEVRPPPVEELSAFNYDGTQESIDALVESLPPNNFEIERIDDDQWSYSYMGAHTLVVTTDQVVVFTVYPELNSCATPSTPMSIGQFESIYRNVS